MVILCPYLYKLKNNICLLSKFNICNIIKLKLTFFTTYGFSVKLVFNKIIKILRTLKKK